MKLTIRIIALAAIILSCLSCSKANEPIKAMSFNLRYANNHDGQNVWSNREQRVREFLIAQNPDILGVQEALHSQIEFLDSLLLGFKREGVARDDGNTEGEYSAVYYNANKFERLDGGTYWLSQTPNSVSFGWDAACRRVVSWVKLKEKGGNKEFYFLNTHFDHQGTEARRNSAKMIVDAVKGFGSDAKVLVSGDFNALETEEPIQVILEDGSLLDSRKVAATTSGPQSTYHGFGKGDVGIIDYIFVTPNVSVISNDIVFENNNGVYLSDHNPIVIKCKL